MAAAASSSSTPRQSYYHVFLSFRGEDTRKNFTDHLFHALKDAGIRTFRDDEELETGDCISSGLLKAIQESKVSIVVFSKDYASSRWCLDELVEILECKKANRQVVLPVFYYVDPSDVRKQKGSFADAFVRHDQVFEENKVKTWRSALKEAASLSGFHLQNQYEAKFIKEIVERVVRQVNPKCLHVAKYPVGLDYHEKMINSLLGTRKDVLLVGIYGIGGVGKTTIAKHLYNSAIHKYERCCFLENIREESKQPNGLLHLQKQLYSEVLRKHKVKITNLSSGISLLEHRLGSKRVLIVLDDLDQLEQLNSLAGSRCWFAKGSLVIITTRNKHLLEQADVDVKYEVNELNYEDSMKLFSWHAFGNPVPRESYVSILKDIVMHAGGLPLALEVLGSSLVNKGISVWKSMLQKLKVIPHDKIQAKLKISFEALDDTEKDIFLDVACFFVGMKKGLATMIFDGCGFFGDVGISALEDRCLLKILNGVLSMHDLIRDMGRGIVNEKFPREPGKRTRLWRQDDVLDVLKDNKGTEAIEGMILNLPTREYFSTRPFASIPNLRLLKLNNVDLGGSFEGLFKELRWLCWHGCSLQSLPPELHPRKLVCLDMQRSNLKILWEGIKFLGNLRSMDLSESKFLTTTPDFGEVPNLEELSLGICESLSNIDPSIGHLNKLISLDLSFCCGLKSLPSSISGLTSLQRLYVNRCSNLEAFPEQLGDMKSLQFINATGAGIKELPDSIGNLGQLAGLDLNDCPSIKSLPNSLCKLRSLKELNLYTCLSLEGFPEQLENMECLEVLSVTQTAIKGQLPLSIGLLHNLKDLDLSGNDFCCLPSITELTHLKGLALNGCGRLESILGLPSNLEWLTANDCTSLRTLPTLSKLDHLERIELRNCRSFVEIQGLENLAFIKSIDLEGCTSLEKLPNLSDLEYLTWISLKNCNKLFDIEGLKNLKVVEEIFLKGCISLEKLPNLFIIKTLEILDLQNCSRLVEIQGLENVKSVKSIRLGGCSSSLSTSVLENFLFQGPCEQPLFSELYLLRQDIPNCFEYQGTGGSTISFHVPLHFPDDSFHVIIWVDYDRGNGTDYCEILYLHINGETEDTKWSCDIWAGEGAGKVSCVIHVPHMYQIKRGESLRVSFETFTSHPEGEFQLKLGRCGVYLTNTSERRIPSLLPLRLNKERVQLKRGIDSNIVGTSCDGSKRMKLTETSLPFPQCLDLISLNPEVKDSHQESGKTEQRP